MDNIDKEMTEEEKKDCIDRAKELMPLGDADFISPEDTFEFQCQRCGRCCMNRGDIIINSWDVFKAAKELGITCKEFVKKYCIETLGAHSKLPMVLIGQKENGMCHFLEFDYINEGLFKCTINDVKPGACANHPIGLVTHYSPNEGATGTSFIKVDQCDNSKHPVQQKVKDWMKHYYEHYDEIMASHDFVSIYQKHYNFRKWYFIAALCQKLAYLNGKDPKDDLGVLSFGASCEKMMHFTYYNFDTSLPYIEQAKKNQERLEEFLKVNDAVVEKFEQNFDEKIFSDSELNIDKLLEINDKGPDGNAKQPMMDLNEYVMFIASKIEFKDVDDEDDNKEE